MTGPRPRVLVCEDSRTVATALSRTIEHEGLLEVAAIAGSAEEAIALLPGLKPDLVTMDIELPGMSGLQAVEEIMSAQPVPILVLSSLVQASSPHTASALAAGALDAVAKDAVDLRDPESDSARTFRRRLVLLSRARVIRHPRARLKAQLPPRRPSGRTASAIGICASTGGPQALAAVLGALPATFPIPVLVVQHIGAGFGEGLANWLEGAVPLTVRVAADGDAVEPGIWLAPDDAHLRLKPSGRLALDRVTVAGPHRPSGDVLLRSLAMSIGRRAVSVVLTGMGSDGAEGSYAVHQAGGLTIAQDEATSVIYGMPRAAAALGVDLVLPMTEIGPELLSLSPIEAVA